MFATFHPNVLTMCPTDFHRFQWPLWDFTRRVHATCLSLNARIFEKRDPERFQSFLQKLLKRKGSVNVGALQPHELLKKAIKPSSSMEKMLAQAQWRSLVTQVRANPTTLVRD